MYREFQELAICFRSHVSNIKASVYTENVEMETICSLFNFEKVVAYIFQYIAHLELAKMK